MPEVVPTGTSQVRKPRKITPERAKELRGKMPELLVKIDAVLAEYPSHYGRKS